MKRIKTILALILLSCLVMSDVFAQDISTQGTDFWVSFIGNGFKTRYPNIGSPYTWLRIQLIVSAKRDCQCTVSNPNTGYSRSFQVEANNPYLYDNIPWEEAYMELNEYGQVLSKGLHVTADDTVSVYCANIAEVSFDASYVLPTPALGDDYIIQTYDQSNGPSGNYYNYCTSAFVIVAAEAGQTTIDITPSTTTYDGHSPGTEYTITLQQGEAYQVRSTIGDDLSGTRVTARDCKKIAVFNGNNLTQVPQGGNDSDCIFEQAMPLTAWGKKFVVTASLGRQLNDYVKITSAFDNNEILKNGEPFTVLGAGESITYELRQADRSCFIEASASCAVYLYNHSADGYAGVAGDGAPSMVWIAPIEQRIDEITFSTFNYESEYNTHIDDHYVNIIVSAEDINNVYLDNRLLPAGDFEAIPGTDAYRFIRRGVEHGSHHLSCSNGFNAHVYGFGHAKGYAYLVGSNAANLSTSLTLNNETVLPDEDFSYCVDEPITFHVDVNLPNYDLVWDFGDGTTSTQNPVTHTYNERRVYNVSMAITTDSGGCTGASGDTTHFTIDATQRYIIEHESICEGELYSGHGFNNIHILNDTILTRLQDNPMHPECKDSLLVFVAAHPAYHIPYDHESRCWQGQPGVYDEHGFSFVYDHAGTYDRTLYLQTIDGCDSIITLHLTVAEQISYEFEHHECSSSYVWDGTTYTAPGIYQKNYVSAGGCDSIAILHLTMGMPQYTAFDTITCGVFVWNGQEYTQSGNYQQEFLTIDGCDSIVDCSLLISGDVEGETTTFSGCDSYFWADSLYTLSGQYERTLSTTLGCDSVVHLDLHLDYTPDPSDIFPKDPNNTAPHWVITATEFQINSYEFHIWDHNILCHWDSITWEFENDDLQWILEPDQHTTPIGKTVRMIVLNHVDDTVWLHARIYNGCAPDGIERRYWFVCSFYGVDEDGTSTSDLVVAPNPNNGEMRLYFEGFEGNVNFKVYDMRGTLLDERQYYIQGQDFSRNYKIPGATSGLYLFVVTDKNGRIISKKVTKF